VESLESYLERLASSAPTPGGGSAATLVGAFAASLVAMVARITRDNRNYADKGTLADELIRDADQLRTKLSEARIADERAYRAVVDATTLPRLTPEQKSARTAVLQAALTGAAAAPLHAAELAVATLRVAEGAHALGNRHLESDVVCAAIFARAALEAAAANVRINHAFMKDLDVVREQEAELSALERAGAELYARVNRTARS